MPFSWKQCVNNALMLEGTSKTKIFNYLDQDNSFEMCFSVIYIEFSTKLTIVKNKTSFDEITTSLV